MYIRQVAVCSSRFAASFRFSTTVAVDDVARKEKVMMLNMREMLLKELVIAEKEMKKLLNWQD